ncbi:MAG: DNA repair protein RecN [Bacteroidales bacterium]|nr:DNA repair protein RecN [Bacteroidales bacterium]
MLSSLHIENYILLDSLDVQFPEGLIIISGSTGAGKSVILGALGLIEGAKADATALRDSGKNCVIEAEFTNISIDKDILEENDVETEGDSLTIRRVIMPTGRSRAFINDCPVPVTVLSELSPSLFDIHSQHQNLLLSSKSFSLKTVDAYSGNEGLLNQCKSLFSRLGSLEKELKDTEAKLRKINQDSDYNDAQLQALKAADLKEGEIEALETELSQLSNAEEIKAALYSATEAFTPTNDSAGIITSIKDALRNLEKIIQYCPTLEPLIERLQSAKYELEDISAEVESLNENIALNAERLQWVDERLGLLYGLLRRYSVETIGELIAIRDELAGNAFSKEDLEEKIALLLSDINTARKEYETLCDKLHSKRVSASGKLSALIESKLQALEMGSARFKVDIRKVAESATGIDEAVFLFSATGSDTLVDAAKKASGGELSRIMLAIKSILAEYSSLPTIIFDEIDTGISGSVADKTGSMICSMGEKMQVFAITHLPQVAAKGRAHYLVQKTDDKNPVTTMTLIEGEARLREIARMLSGSTITPEALANAKTLLVSI